MIPVRFPSLSSISASAAPAEGQPKAEARLATPCICLWSCPVFAGGSQPVTQATSVGGGCYPHFSTTVWHRLRAEIYRGVGGCTESSQPPCSRRAAGNRQSSSLTTGSHRGKRMDVHKCSWKNPIFDSLGGERQVSLGSDCHPQEQAQPLGGKAERRPPPEDLEDSGGVVPTILTEFSPWINRWGLGDDRALPQTQSRRNLCRSPIREWRLCGRMTHPRSGHRPRSGREVVSRSHQRPFCSRGRSRRVHLRSPQGCANPPLGFPRRRGGRTILDGPHPLARPGPPCQRSR